MTLLTSPVSDSTTLRHRRFSVDEYHRMAVAGILAEGEKVELLEGWIVDKMTKNPRHEYTVDLINEVLSRRVPQGWRVRVQPAVSLVDSEPEPDVAVVRGPASRYQQRHPAPDDIALVIEVADSSLAQDRGIKVRVYARSGVAAYWIANLMEKTIEVYADPTGPCDAPTYRQWHVYHPGEAVPFSVGLQRVGDIPVE